MIQTRLPLTDAGIDALAVARVRSAYKTVAKEAGYKVIADLMGVDEATVSLKLDGKNRNDLRLSDVMVLKRLDLRGVIKAAEDAALDPETTAQKVVDRLPGVLRKYLAEELAELLENDLGLR